jgi:hypothetical protein
LVIINGLYAIAVIISHHLPFKYIFYNGLVNSFSFEASRKGPTVCTLFLPRPSFQILKEGLYPMAKVLENKE